MGSVAPKLPGIGIVVDWSSIMPAHVLDVDALASSMSLNVRFVSRGRQLKCSCRLLSRADVHEPPKIVALLLLNHILGWRKKRRLAVPPTFA